MGQVTHLFLATGSRRPMREIESTAAIADRGLEGCRHGRPGSRRQILLLDRQTLDTFGLQPGQLKENITTCGIDEDSLVKGQHLALGEAVLEVTGSCEPCSRMDEIRMGLQQELEGKRGILCRVIEGGRIQRGDTIQLVAAQAAAPEIGGTR